MENIINNKSMTLTKSLKQNIDIFKNTFQNDETLVFRVFENIYMNNIKCCVIFFGNMIDKKDVNEYIIKPLMNSEIFNSEFEANKPIYPSIIDMIGRRVITAGNIGKDKDIKSIVNKLLYGSTLLMIDGEAEALLINTKGWKVREPIEPETEKTLKGPKEGFTEDMATNLSLIRRRIRSTELRPIFMEVGSVTRTKICICYIEGIVSDKILQELINRIKNIDIDEILYSQSLEEMIRDAPMSVFKTIGSSERPDVICGKILEGRIAIIVDGVPFALTVPYIFQEYFQSADDYATNYLFASFNRFIRMLAFFFGLSVPALYVSITTYHHELIPTALLLSIAANREGLPFPTVVESITMLIGFDFLREAGTRLPTPVGQAVSIVGALVLGEAAVSARLVSAPMVITAALTGISSFLIPKMLGPFIIIRLIFLLLSSFLGLYGYVFGVIGLFIYLFSLRSFGVPYMLYVAEIKLEYVKDTIVRVPWYMMRLRPKFVGWNFIRKRGVNHKPAKRGE
jgi:spore germination protein KA